MIISRNKQQQQHDGNDEATPLLSPPKDHQSHSLSRKRLLIVFLGLALVQFTSFLDQTAISTSLPAIASGLNTGSSISWVAASFLTTSTSIQLINSRLSDIFGRRSCLIGALVIMGLGNLLSGFSQTPVQLYATRAFSGLGAGAINALVQITISDITTLHQRGYYFGIVGIAVALGNGLGPVIGGALTQYSSWRWAFWFICPLTALAVVYLALVLPRSTAPEKVWEKIKMMDWLGVFSSMTGVVLCLVSLNPLPCDHIWMYRARNRFHGITDYDWQIPLSRGGLANAWKLPINIAMFVSGVLIFTGFILLEFWFVKLPILPSECQPTSSSLN